MLPVPNAEVARMGKIVAAGITYLPKPYPTARLGQASRECLDNQ